VRRVARRLHAFQIDPINVLVRAQYLPAYARLGPYAVRVLDELAYERHELFEYYGHQASLLPTTTYPLFRWRMDAHAAAESGHWRVEPAFAAAALDEVAARGPLASSDLADRGRRGRREHGWRWSDGKRVMSSLLVAGRLAVAGRRGIEQLYDLTERVIPRAVLDATPPDPDEAKRQLLVLAARAMGVATAADLADYFHIGGAYDRAADPHVKRVPALLADLVDDGRLLTIDVDGWRDPAYLHPDARVPGRVAACTLVSPFDSLIWERKRTQRLFGFDYRIEIYVPEAKRVHGYYVLPFLFGDQLVARVDLKADRRGSALLVQAAYAEPGIDERVVAAELDGELDTLRTWLGLDRVVVRRRGDLAGALRPVCG
jgi:uncharacterized protein YcaQ